MWRSADRISLEKKPSTRLSPGAVLGGEGELEATRRLLGEPNLGLLGDVRGMIVEDQLDRCMRRIGVDQLEEFDELAAAAAVLDRGVNLSSQQINGPETLVFGVARKGGMCAGLGRQVRGRGRSPECRASRHRK